MFDNLKNLIQSGTKTLRDMEERIAWGVASGRITGTQADELTELAAEQAAPPDVPESTEIAVRLGALEASVALLGARLAALESGTGESSGEGAGGQETPVGPPDGVPNWVPGTAYMYGAVVWKDGSCWVSQEGNNRFTPGVEAWAWKKA